MPDSLKNDNCLKKWSAFLVHSLNGDQIVERILASRKGRGSVDSQDANRLMKQIWRGYPARNLLRLIDSDNDWAAEQGAFALAETADAAADVLPDLARLIAHPNPRVRFWIVDYLLYSIEVDLTLARFIRTFFSDSDAMVRAYAMKQFSLLPSSILDAAAEHINGIVDEVEHRNLFRQMQSADHLEISRGLRSADMIARTAAMSAALRAGELSEAHEEIAKTSGDAALEREVINIRTLATEQK